MLSGRAGALCLYGATAAPPSTRPPLLLVHSVNAAASAAEVRPVFEHVAARGPVFALDLPGFGLSDRSERRYTPRLMTDAVHEALDEIARRHGSGPIDALAVSLGCEFLARAAVESPDRFRRLALVSPTGFNGPRRRRGAAGGSLGPPWLLSALYGPGWGAALFRALTRPGVIRYFLRRTFGSQTIDEGLWRYAVLTARVPGAEHAPLHFLAAALFSTDVNTLYEQLRQPVWMSHGIRGDFIDYRGIDSVSGRQNWRIDVLPTGALPYFEMPADFCARLDAFLGSEAA
jgi:pimeloyl-ACP methyl ester carboxylesterase